MNASHDDERTAETRPGAESVRVAEIVIFDVAAPLATYSLVHSARLSTVTALVLSGVVPAAWRLRSSGTIVLTSSAPWS